jgi:Domain of unknown function (DUF397)
MTVPHGHEGWKKSSYSTQTDNCVEVCVTSGGAAVRDTKARDGGHISVPAVAWTAFLASATK